MCGCKAPLESFAFCTKCGALHERALLSPFEVFGLKREFSLDMTALKKAYIALQKRLHPDRFIHKGLERERAEYYASYINGAYKMLADPLQRAAFLLSGYADDFSMADLKTQMENREYLEDLNSQKGLDDFEKKVLDAQRQWEEKMATAFKEGTLEKAKQCLLHLKYNARLLSDIHHKRERL